jgi:hypothetical protein
MISADKFQFSSVSWNITKESSSSQLIESVPSTRPSNLASTFRMSWSFLNGMLRLILSSLFYPWLNALQTIKIWDMQIRRLKERIKTIEIDTQQILAYASLHFDSQCRLTGGKFPYIPSLLHKHLG